MLKKIKITMILVSMSLPLVVGAQPRELYKANVGANAEVKAEMKVRVETRASTTQMRQEMRASTTLRMEERREGMLAKREGMIQKRVEILARQFRAALENLENILTRVESRIEKFKDRGADVSESARYAALARTRIGEAQVDLDAFLNASTSATSTIRVFHTEVRGHLKSIHESLMKAVRALKAGVGVRATSTTTTTVE